MKWPDRQTEDSWLTKGASTIVGIDEVGKGSWAGPLTLGAVVLRQDADLEGIRDSKQLSAAKRTELYVTRHRWVEAEGIGHASALECDELGMSEAQRLAARRALEDLGVVPDRVLVDGRWDFIENGCTTAIVKGDQSVASIAAASVLAKVVRDQMMQKLAEHYPAYDFAKNKGYSSPSHKVALNGYGPCPEHRQSWVFMDKLPWTGIQRRTREADLAPSLFDL